MSHMFLDKLILFYRRINNLIPHIFAFLLNIFAFACSYNLLHGYLEKYVIRNLLMPITISVICQINSVMNQKTPTSCTDVHFCFCRPHMVHSAMLSQSVAALQRWGSYSHVHHLSCRLTDPITLHSYTAVIFAFLFFISTLWIVFLLKCISQLQHSVI